MQGDDRHSVKRAHQVAAAVAVAPACDGKQQSMLLGV